jgi:3-phosphoshikimate 1-carboxyvinyltransferase
VRGTARVPGDKSISHRAALVAALAEGISRIMGFSPAGDCTATLSVLESLGMAVDWRDGTLAIRGRSGRPFDPPASALDCGRSGTTMRLGAGMLAADRGPFELTGDPQLLARPMERVAVPLRAMGADVHTAADGRPPLRIRGGALIGIEYELPVASAQVKSAVLLAGLRADGETTVVEPVTTRDHTERLLAAAGIDVRTSRGRSTIRPGVPAAFDLDVPGDLSSAAVLLAAAALLPRSDLVVETVGLNPTRTGFVEVLRRMGAAVEVSPGTEGIEPSGELRVRHAALQAVAIGPKDVPGVIDELPLIGALATQAEGVTEVQGAGELRVKESDRIAGLVGGLRELGAETEELPDGFVVRGPVQLRGGRVDARSDHRLAMAFTLAGLVAAGPVAIEGVEFVGDSFPGFLRALEGLR